jgi:type I restriction enzyme S subunit
MVPEGWEVKRLDELTLFIKDGTHGTHADVENGIPLLSAKDIDNGKILLDNNPRLISAEDYSQIHKKYLIEEGDVLLTVVGTIGRLAIVQTKKTFTLQRSVAIIRTSKTTNNIFLYCAMQSERFFNQLLLRTNASAQGGIYLGELAKCTLPCPQNLAEQQKIATILSTLDRTIEATQKLIDKEKMVKKGLMADLLMHGIDEQGRIRSPQTHRYVDSPLGMIPEGWEVKLLKELGDCINGLTYSPDDVVDHNGILVLRSSNIQGNKLAFEDNVYVRPNMRIKDRIQANDILICVRNGSKALIGKNALITEEVHGQAHGAFMTVFRTQDYKYVFQLFQSDIYTTQVEKNLGATINSINNSDLLMFMFPMPTSLNERQKIAQILSAQDRKIETEEANLAKLQKLKKGLMGDLLSGKVRVKV